jgi:hypothetical protein
VLPGLTRSNPGTWVTLGAGLVGQIGSCGRMPRILTEPEMERRKFVEAALRRDCPMAEVWEALRGQPEDGPQRC